jgi:hypothetical protein
MKFTDGYWQRNAYRNKADTEVEATKFFKKTQSCKRDE